MLRKKRLGERLVEEGVIDKLQLRAALGQQAQWGKSLGRTLLEMRLVAEEQLIPILSDQLKVPAINLGSLRLDPEAVALLDEPFCRSHECIAFKYHEQGKFLDVAMADPQSPSLFDELRVLTRCNIRPFLAGPSAIRHTIDRAFGEDLKDIKLQFQLAENVFDFGDEPDEEGALDPCVASPRRGDTLEEPAVTLPLPGPASAIFAAAGGQTRRTSRPTPTEPFAIPSLEAAPSGGLRRSLTGPFPASPEAAPLQRSLTGPQQTRREAPASAEESGDAWDADPQVQRLEQRVAALEEQLDRQQRLTRGLIEQLRELFGQLADLSLLEAAPNHPLIKRGPATEPAAPEPLPGSPPPPRSPEPRPQSRPASPPPAAQPSRAPAPRRPQELSPPMRAPTAPPPTSARPAPARPSALAAAPDDDDDVEFVAGTGRLVGSSPRPAPQSVRPAAAPAALTGAEPTMPLLEIPRESPCVVAMDLGTTRSSVATVIDGRVSVLKLPGGEWDIPSVVGFREDGSVMLGKGARTMLGSDPENAVASPKRLLGRRFDEPGLAPYLAQLGMKAHAGARGDVVLSSYGRELPVSEACAHILNLLRLVAERNLKRPVQDVVLTVPVTYVDQQLHALAAAAQQANLRVLEFLPEPVAAALACISDPACEGLVAVYDFGGGTFDFSVVEVGQTMKVVAASGDGWLGGDDLDEALANAAANAFWQQTKVELRNQAHHWQRLLLRAEMTKRALTEQEEAVLRLPGAARTAEGEIDLVCRITRAQFAALAQDIIKRSLETCREALLSRHIQVSDLNAVYLSGGTSYVPAVRAAVAEFFGQEPRVVIPPERMVVVGAAVHGSLCAERLAG